jgi:hypothetical protein
MALTETLQLCSAVSSELPRSVEHLLLKTRLKFELMTGAKTAVNAPSLGGDVET